MPIQSRHQSFENFGFSFVIPDIKALFKSSDCNAAEFQIFV